MRLRWLFLRSRRTELAAAGVLMVVAGAWAWGRWLGQVDGSLTVALVLFPLFAGTLLGVVTTSQCAELERAVSRRLFDLRASQSLGLLAVAGGLLIVVRPWPEPHAWEIAARNLSAFTGLSLLAAAIFGGRLAWIGPVGYGIGSHVAGNDPKPRGWALTAQPASDDLALAIATAVLLAGLVLVSYRGARDPTNDAA